MDILIKGMEMPKERKMFVIEPCGSVWIQIADTSYFCTGSKAIELPSHGDLIERSKVHEAITQAYCLEDVPSIIDQLVPTVLEAST